MAGSLTASLGQRLFILALLALAAGRLSAQATARIAFTTSRDGNSEIYTMNVDGTNPVNLTRSPASDFDPAWSPDGTKIAFTSDRDGNQELYTMDANGCNVTRLTNSAGRDFDPSWSPDGTKIAFHTDRDGNDEIYVMNADGSNPVNLSRTPTIPESSPRWSPDGRKILFSSLGAIRVMDADGSNQTPIPTPTFSNSNPIWSPDGSRIAYTSDYVVYVANADGSNPLPVSGSFGIGTYATSWSPDGTRIAFMSDRAGGYQIYSMNPDGSNVTRLTDNGGSDASWSVSLPASSGGPCALNTVALWRFDETSGNSVADTTGANPGSAVGTTIVSGLFANARSYRGGGLGDYVVVPHIPNSKLTDLSQITIEAWIYPTGFDLGIYNSAERIVAKGDESGVYNLYVLTITRNVDASGGASSFDYFTVGMAFGSNGVGSGATSSITHLPSRWYYVVGTYDGSKARVYVNGILEAEGAAAPGAVVTTTDPLYVNNHTFNNHGSSSNGRMGGIIDEVRISNGARSASEIQNIYAAASASFSGTVTDAGTGAGIPGASVVWGSYSTTTDGSGNYNLNSLPCQTNALTVSKSGYQTLSQSYTPTCNASNLKNITLTGAVTLPGEYTPDAHTVLLLHMDEPSGSQVADASGLGNNATATGTTIVPGVFGNARAFANNFGDVAHDYLTVNNSATLNPPNALTIEAWVYLTAPAAGWPNGIPFISRDDSWGGVQGYTTGFYTPCGNNAENAQFFYDGYLSLCVSEGLTLNSWTHVAWTVGSDGATKTVKAYKNGRLVGQQTVPGGMQQNSLVTYIGRRWGSAGGFPYNGGFAGFIDEVRISDVVRTDAEILAGFLGGFSTSFSGTVTDTGTGAGISGASVSWASYSTTTDAGGSYNLNALSCETNTLMVSKSGYQSFSQSYTPTCKASNLKNVTLTAAAVLLPAPTLSSPPNGGGNQLTTPTFSWSQVTGASSYRIMAAQNQASLPTDPAASTCGGCAINDTTTALSYSPPAPLAAGTTYYWQVHGRSASDYGTWSSPWSFTTTLPSSTAFSGTVTDAATAAGLSGASVNWGSFSTTTDASGNYNLNSLPCQTNTLTVSKSGYQSLSQSYTPTCNASNVKNVTLTTTYGTIQVNATKDGSPFSGSVSYQLTGASSLSGSAVPATFSNQPSGTYTLVYLSGGPADTTLQSITPAASQSLASASTITFTLNFATTTTTGTLIWPVLPDNRANLGQGYAHYNLVSPLQYHTGLDLAAAEGAVVRAAAAGTVRSLPMADGQFNGDNHCMGNVVIIDHGGSFTLYAHLQSITTLQGTFVSQGTQIGTVGRTPTTSRLGCTPPATAHLHFEVKDRGVLGDQTDSGPEWGYTPNHPDQYLYHNPILTLHTVSTASGRLTVATDGVNLRVGPGGAAGTAYRVISQVDGGTTLESRFSSGPTTTPSCTGWFQVRRTDGVCSTVGSCFSDSYGGQQPEAWVCADFVSSTGVIQVNATKDGSPFSGSVSYQLTGASSLSGGAVPAAFSNQPSGTYTLVYLSGGPAGTTLQSITPAASQSLASASTVTFTLNFATTAASTAFSGMVTDAGTGTGISGASVVWGPYSTTTDGNGNYNLNSLPCQTNTLTVSKSGYQTFSQSYAPTCDTTSNLKNVMLTAVITISGCVQIGGQPAAPGHSGLERTVSLLDATVVPPAVTPYQTAIGANGCYSLQARPALYTFQVSYSYLDFYYDVSEPSHTPMVFEKRRALATSDQPDIAFPTPVVFVHGIITGRAKWGDWAAWLDNHWPAQIYFKPNYGDIDDYPHEASQLRFLLAADFGSLTSNEVPPYRIIAHSKGGLVVRAFTTLYKGDLEAKAATDVIMLGTPNNGTDFCFLESLVGLGTCTLQDFNKLYPWFGEPPGGANPNPVRVHVVAGTAGSDPKVPLVSSLCAQPPSDGVVPVNSVKTIDDGVTSTPLDGIVVPAAHTELGSQATLGLLENVILPYYGQTSIPASFAFPQCPPLYKTPATDCQSATPVYDPCMGGKGYRATAPGEGVCDLVPPTAGSVMATIAWLPPAGGLTAPTLVNAGSTLALGGPLCPPVSKAGTAAVPTTSPALLRYDVYRDAQPIVAVNGERRIGSAAAAATTFTDPFPAAGLNYYAVTAVYDSAESGPSNSLGVTVSGSASCVTGPNTICVSANRFRVQVAWRAVNLGTSGVGRAVPLTSDTGYFWFFQDTNVELVVKVLDGRAINGHFWVFYGALSDVEYTITVTDTVTGEVRMYVNPRGRLASVADTSAFPLGESSASVVDEAELAAGSRERGSMGGLLDALNARPLEAAGGCVAGPTILCLNGGRFRLEAAWRALNVGTSGAGQAVSLTSDTGYFWFFQDTNVELSIKVLDGRGVNGHFWVFYGALSNVEYTITVTDTVTGAVRTYFNPQGTLASVADTSAF